MTAQLVPESADAEETRPEFMALEHELSQLFAAGHQLVRERAAAVHPDLSPGAYKALVSLVRSGPKHAGTLATELAVDKSVISRIVKQIEDLGLLERRPDPTDGRAHYLAATDEAVRRVDAVRAMHREHLNRHLSAWAPEDIREFTRLLSQLNSAAVR